MKTHKTIASAVALLLTIATGTASALTVTSSNSANTLASLIGGSGITISNATLSSASTTGSGIFAGALGAIGFDNGVLLTTGTVDCAVGPNNSSACTGAGTKSSLAFDFTTTTGNGFLNYVFASEEYPEYVGSGFNDSFQLLLNGVNIALLPGTSTAVTINNVNGATNSAYFKSNTAATYDTQYDGLTTVLTAGKTGLTGLNHFEFIIQDIGDASLDSGVFIQAGAFGSTVTPSSVPEPTSIALLGLGLLDFAASRRKSAK